MKEYIVIGNFKYKNNQYEMLLDENNKYFFLKTNQNREYEYITLSELLKLTNMFHYKDNALLIEKNHNQERKKKLVPKIWIGTSLVTLSLSLLLVLNTWHSTRIDLSSDAKPVTMYTDSISYDNVMEIEKDETQKEIEKILQDIERQQDRFEVEKETDAMFSRIIYDNSALDDALGYPKEEITYDTIRETIQNNPNIPNRFKELYILLANNLEKQYPTMDLRVWYENLKTIKINEVSEMEMRIKCVSTTAFACYRKDENAIYTVEGYDYVPGTWDYQVIMHEMCHPIRSAFIPREDKEIRVQFQNSSGNGTIIDEAMNSLLSLRSYDPDEKDIAYQLQSNMIEAMVDSMDNYTYQDYVEHNLTYFENELNIQNGNDRAVEMISMMELQYNDYHNDKITVEQEQFYDLYDYIARMYYQKRITSTTSYDDALKIRDELIERITFDVPEDYNIDTNHFREFFEAYCQEIGITHEKTL